MGSRDNFPQTAGTTQRIVGTYVHSTKRKGQRTTSVQDAKLPSITLHPNSTMKKRAKQIYEATGSFREIVTKIIPILRRAYTISLI